jgi:hypothetical protein
MEGEDLEDSMEETVPDKCTDTSQASSSVTGQPKIYHRWTVKGYWQDKHKHSLPDGWCEVFHTSGFPLYFHKQTRVVTLSRPYFLGSTSVRHHLIPVAAIPCLYMKRLQDEQNDTESSPTIDNEPKCPFQIRQETDECSTGHGKRKRSGGGGDDDDDDDVEEGEISSPNASTAALLDESTSLSLPLMSMSTTIESNNPAAVPSMATRPMKPQQLPVSLQILTNSTLDDALRFSTLTSDQLRVYCQRRFAFEQREFKFFPSLGDKWKYIRQAQMKRREMNTPADAQIIELKPPSNDSSVVVSATLKTTNTLPQPSIKSSTSTSELNGSTANKKVTIDLYPSKSPIALLQEYAFKVLKASVRYDWFTTDVSNSPFGCRVLVGETVYGTGIGRNKRTAKLNATEESLIILVPQYKKLQQQQQQQQPMASKEIPMEDKSADDEGCIDDDEPSSSVSEQRTNESHDVEHVNSTLLDEYLISDINIYDVCVTLGKPTPYQMLEKSLTYNALTRGESNIKLTMTKKPMFTHIALEIGSEHREEAQAKDKAHAKNLGKITTSPL